MEAMKALVWEGPFQVTIKEVEKHRRNKVRCSLGPNRLVFAEAI